MPRRRPAAVLALALAALLAGCSRGDSPSTPETALAAWVSAMQSSRSDVGARRRAYELLSGPARASLAERAARASQLSGRDMQPWEMLAPGRFAMRFAFDPESNRARVAGDRAVVSVRGPGGETAEVPMVLEGGRWRVDLDLPPMQSARPDADGGL